LRAAARHQLVEVACPAAYGFVLVEELQIALVELSEPVLPANILEVALVPIRREVDAEDAGFLIATCAGDACRLAAALFCPATNFIMVGCSPG
jgi:hypothetical protein